MSAHATTSPVIPEVAPIKRLPKIYKFPGLNNTPLSLKIAYDDPLPQKHVYSTPYRNKEEWPRKTNHRFAPTKNLLLLRVADTGWVGKSCRTAFSELLQLLDGTSFMLCDSYIANAVVGNVTMEQDTRRRFYVADTLTRPSGSGGEVMAWQFNGTRRPIAVYIPRTAILTSEDCILIVPTTALKKIQPIVPADSATHFAFEQVWATGLATHTIHHTFKAPHGCGGLFFLLKLIHDSHIPRWPVFQNAVWRYRDRHKSTFQRIETRFGAFWCRYCAGQPQSS